MWLEFTALTGSLTTYREGCTDGFPHGESTLGSAMHCHKFLDRPTGDVGLFYADIGCYSKVQPRFELGKS